MTIKLMRRDKTGSGTIATEVIGPLSSLTGGTNAPHQKVSFTDFKVTEFSAGGIASKVTRPIGEAELVSGANYMLSWVMIGQVGDEVEYFLDRASDAAGATFKPIAKDKIPAPGIGLAFSEATPSGCIWRNGIFFKG